MASDRPLAVFPRCPSLIDFNSVNWCVCVHNSHSARIPTLIDVEQHLAQQRAQCCCIQSCTLLTCAEKIPNLRSVVGSSVKPSPCDPPRASPCLHLFRFVAWLSCLFWKDGVWYTATTFQCWNPPALGCSVKNPTWLTRQALGGPMGWVTYRSSSQSRGFKHSYTMCALFQQLHSSNFRSNLSSHLWSFTYTWDLFLSASKCSVQ